MGEREDLEMSRIAFAEGDAKKWYGIVAGKMYYMPPVYRWVMYVT